MRLLAAVSLLLALAGSAGAAESPAPTLDFYPQAGILWQDLYPSNFVDLEPGPAIEDWACGGQTYDGHTGADTMIRSFAEKVVGVPVFAALDGVVSAVQDGLPDESRGGANPGPDNHVELDGDGGIRTVYGHLRRNSITVRVGERVVQGQQIGFTASSGNSTWPHLHFTVLRGAEVLEPFAGACRPGASLWRSQPPTPREPYVRDVAVSARPMFGLSDLPFDEAVRTGTFVVGRRHVDLRIELGAVWDRGQWSLRFDRPDGSAAWRRVGSMSWPLIRGTTRARWGMRVDLGTPGRWRIVFALGGRTTRRCPARRRRDARRGRQPFAECRLDRRSAASRRSLRVLRPHVARDGGSRLRARPLPLPLDGRGRTRPGRRLGRAERRPLARPRAGDMLGHAVGWEARGTGGERRRPLASAGCRARPEHASLQARPARSTSETH